MNAPRLLATLLLATALSGCLGLDQKKKQEAANAGEPPTMKDASGDTSYEAFLGRLRTAVARRDLNVIASMMTSNFGYSLEPLREGDGVFQYWDENNLWPELEAILAERFVPKGAFMVAPPPFATDETYTGYRAGLTRVGGVWRFAYFVSG